MDHIEETQVEIVELARAMVDVIADKKGEDIVLLDMQGKTIITDYFVICSGSSERQLKAIVEGMRDEIKKTYGISPRRVDGAAETGWMLMDYSDIIVHAFSPETRSYYDLEDLWREAPVLLKIK